MPADVFITGDSFGFGSCLPEKDSIAGQVRQSHPLTINAGQGGNGPLTELASIREFAVPTKARHVFWLFFENDLDDQEREAKNPILNRYFERGFRSSSSVARQNSRPSSKTLPRDTFKALLSISPHRRTTH